KNVNVDAIEKGWMVLDIGPETAKVYRDVIKNSKLIVWNGPMGVFEIEAFSKGTKAVAEALRDTEGYTIMAVVILQRQLKNLVLPILWIIFQLAEVLR